jgi:hypothetical protein
MNMSKARAGGIAAAVLLSAPLALVAAPAEAASVSCQTYTSNGSARGTCRVYSGEVRLRADCAYAPDLYSPWKGKGLWYLWTGSCPWGIRGAIVETRY